MEGGGGGLTRGIFWGRLVIEIELNNFKREVGDDIGTGESAGESGTKD